MNRFVNIIMTFIAIAFLSCSQGQEGAKRDTREQREYLSQMVYKDTLKRFVNLTPQLADSVLDAAVTLGSRDYICVGINAVIDTRDSAATEKDILAAMKRYYKVTDAKDKRPSLKTILASMAVKYASKGDTARARKFLSAAMKDTIPGKEKVMSHLDDRCKKLTLSLLNKGDMATATKVYHHNLVACDSMKLTLAKEHLEEVSKMRYNVVNIVIVIILVIGAFYKFINTSGSRSARVNLSESVTHLRTSAVDCVRLSTH